MTEPTSTKTAPEAVPEDGTWPDVAWTENSEHPAVNATNGSSPGGPRIPRAPHPGVGSRRERKPSPTLVIALLLVVLAALAWLEISHARGGPARIGPIPATGEGPVGQIALNGPWEVISDPTDAGRSHGFAGGSFDGQAVTLPRVVNPYPIVGAAGSRNFAGSVAWYRTALRVPQAGIFAVRFGSVNHRATVWLDGRLLGSHVGTYLPFDERFQTTAGLHTLVVRADWRDPAAMAQAGFHRTWFNFGGINRPVTIRAIGPSELLAPTMRARVDDAGAHVTLSVIVHNNARPRELRVRGTLIHGDQRVAFDFPARRLAHGTSVRLHTVVTVDSPALWSPAHPNLYELDLAAGSESGYYSRVGLRELTWAGGRLRLNGRPLVLRGASLQEDIPGRGDALTPADQGTIVGGLRSLGANATRAQHPLDPELLQRLDAAGIVVWEGVGPVDPAGSWSAVTPNLRRRAEQRVRTTVRQDDLHPSVIAWNLANEVAGNGHRGGEAQYMARVAGMLHRYDPGRMVAVDVWGEHLPHRAGLLYRGLDAVGLTNYEGWYENPLAPPAQIAQRIRARVEQVGRTFSGKVVIVSEFGAEANAFNPPAAPGGYDFQANLIGLHLQTYRKLPRLSGALVWDLRDFAVAPSFAGGSIKRHVPGIRLVKGINQKGLFTYEGAPKPSVAIVRRAFGPPGAAG